MFNFLTICCSVSCKLSVHRKDACVCVCVCVRLVGRSPAAKLEATVGRRIGCLCFCVLLPAGRWPSWKPQLVAELAVCVSVCCCRLTGGQIGSHNWSPCWLSVCLCVAVRWPAAKLEATFDRRVGCMCLCVRCCPLAGGQVGSHIWWPYLLSVSLCVAGRWPAAKLEATFGRQVRCTCLCVLLPAGRWPYWKPQLVAVLAVCVSLCSCPLVGGQIGTHIWSPNSPSVSLCVLLPAAKLEATFDRRDGCLCFCDVARWPPQGWKPQLVAVLAVCVSVYCCPLVGGKVGSHIWLPSSLSVSLCVTARWPAAKLEAAIGCRIGFLCLCVLLLPGWRPNWKPHLVAELAVYVSACCCPLPGCQIGSGVWSPCWLSVSLCVAARWLAAKLEATFGRRICCLCLCVLLSAGRRPNWKPHLIDEWDVCVSVCCCPLAGGRIGSHIWSPSLLSVFLCALLPAGRRPDWKPQLVAVVAVCVSVCCCQLAGGQVGRHIWSPCRLTIFCARCCPSAGGQIGSHIWSPSWLSVSPCVAAGCPAANLEATFGRRRGCLCICVPLPAGQGPNWKPHSVDELLVCVCVCVIICLVVESSGVSVVQRWDFHRRWVRAENTRRTCCIYIW
jgi:hypothetical protein